MVGIRNMTPLQKKRYLIALKKENSSKTTIEMEEKLRHKEKKQIIRERYSPESHYVLYDEENIPMASSWENPNKFVFSDMPDRATLTSMEQIEYDTLAAMNLLRTRPVAFAQMLGMLKEFYSSDGTEFRAPGLNPLVKLGGLADLEDCIEYLKNQTPVPPLVYSKALSLACRDFAEDSDKYGLNQSVFSRCKKYGKLASGDGGENITYGENTGIGTVIHLILQGNLRTELFVNQYKMMGIGCVQHSNSENICVCAFVSFIDRVKRSDEKRSKIPKGVSPQYTGPLVPPIISSSNWSKVNPLALETIIASLGSRKKELKTKKVKGPAMLRKTAVSAVHPLTGKLEVGSRVDFVFQLSGECSVERYILFNNGKPYPFRLQLLKYLTLTLRSIEGPSVTISEQVDSTQLIPVIEYQVE